MTVMEVFTVRCLVDTMNLNTTILGDAVLLQLLVDFTVQLQSPFTVPIRTLHSQSPFAIYLRSLHSQSPFTIVVRNRHSQCAPA
jgi:hypothetical protein